jgi:hypothetical protein
MDTDTNTSQAKRLLASLRDSFRARLPGGLTPMADARLQQTLQHFMREVSRVKGPHADEREILRESYDSMAKWYRRHTDELVSTTPSAGSTAPSAGSTAPSAGSTAQPVIEHAFGAAQQRQPVIEHAVAADVFPGLDVIGGKPFDATDAGSYQASMTTEDYLRYEVTDPLAMFDRLKEARTQAPVPEVVSVGSVQLPPELQSIETRPVINKQTSQAKDLLQRQEDVVKYRETEYNLILNSKDRNWLVNTKENRYNFSVQLDAAYVPTEQNPQITIRNRFRNIVRVEFVKAILPVEGLDVILTRDCSDGGVTTPEASFTSALGLPYVNITLDEMTGNNIGTNEHMDKSLAICQYDAVWKSDHLSATTMTSRGYTLFFPKLMKAQRVYSPAPLSSFQRLSFEVLTPENTVLSKTPDAFAVGGVFFGQTRTVSCYAASKYIFIQTKEWFPLWAFSHLDRVTLAGLTFFSATASSESGFRVLADWLARPEGHVVVGVGYTGAGATDVSDGANSCGYANYIILQNRLTDPSTDGTCDVSPFTGSPLTAAEDVLATELASFPSSLQTGGVLNLSRQVQLVLRVVTREMDSMTNIRPDNI